MSDDPQITLAEEKARREALEKENAATAQAMEQMRAKMRELEEQRARAQTVGTPAADRPLPVTPPGSPMDAQNTGLPPGTPWPSVTQSETDGASGPIWAVTLANVLQKCVSAATPAPVPTPPTTRPRIAYITRSKNSPDKTNYSQ